jgi:hypothetical protein
MRTFTCAAIMVVAAVVCVSAPLAGTAFAQAGSVGGTVGKSDKSQSGGEPERLPPRETAPAHRPREASSSLPGVISFKESSVYGEYTATLRRKSGNAYDATWTHGLISEMTVGISQNSMTLDRHDISGATLGNLCRGHYTGTHSPGASRASGTAVVACNIGGANTTWEASW